MIVEKEALVNFELLGETHWEGGQLVVGDAVVLDVFKAAWGGSRQQGVLRVTWSPVTMQVTSISPSGDGKFAERSEPAK